jgi:hypothetical protein
MESGDGINEGDITCSYVGVADNEDIMTLPPRDNMAMQFEKLQEDGVHERTLEVDYLSALGRRVIDSTLPPMLSTFRFYHNIREWHSTGGTSWIVV